MTYAPWFDGYKKKPAEPTTKPKTEKNNMKTHEQLQNEISGISDQILSICNFAGEKNRDLTTEECSSIATFEGEQLRLRMQAKNLETMELRKPEIEANLNEHIAKNGGGTTAGRVPARCIAKSQTTFASNQDAYDTGKWIQAIFGGDANAFDHCRRNGMIKNAMTTGNNPAGGFLVPEKLESTIIELREQMGIFRQDANVVSMGDAVMILPKMSSELTSYYVGENTTITPSDMGIHQIKLEARKLATLTVVSSELNEDSVISVAEMLARSVAQTFATQEDSAGFLGDGTSTYGGIVGLAGALAAGSKVTATSLQTFGTLTTAFFENVVGSAKMWMNSKPKWYISQQGWANSMQRLLDAVGGNAIQDLANGAPKMFLGYPVQISQVLESRTTGTTGLPACYFGDLQQGVYLGTRRGINVVADSSIYFTQDSIAVRATERFDINVHDRGTSTASGGLVQLVFG